MCACRYRKWQIESTARRLEQSSLLERLQQLLHQSLHSSLAKTVSTARSTLAAIAPGSKAPEPPGFAVCQRENYSPGST